MRLSHFSRQHLPIPVDDLGVTRPVSIWSQPPPCRFGPDQMIGWGKFSARLAAEGTRYLLRAKGAGHLLHGVPPRLLVPSRRRGAEQLFAEAGHSAAGRPRSGSRKPAGVWMAGGERGLASVVTRKGGWTLCLAAFSLDRPRIIAERGEETILVRQQYRGYRERDQQYPAEVDPEQRRQAILRRQEIIFLDDEEVGSLVYQETTSLFVLRDINITQRSNEGIASAVIKWLAIRAASKSQTLVLHRVTNPWIDRLVKTERIFAERPQLSFGRQFGWTVRGKPLPA